MADGAAEPAGGDLFDSLYSIEQDIMDKGFDAGESQGRSSGIQEGWELGLTKGSELGGNLGYIEGLLLAWTAHGLIRTDRHRKLSDSILALINNFPHDDPRDETLLDLQQKAKAKFKVLSSQLNKGAALKQAQPDGISF